MNDTLMRQWAMLRLIPRFPRRIDTPTIHSQLLGQGMAVSLRTVQRDLNSLATTFPLDFDESKPQGWCWQEGASQLEIPSMDAHAALTFNLVEQYMQNMLPRSTLNQMAPWFNAAEGVANSQVSYISKWRDKLRVISSRRCQRCACCSWRGPRSGDWPYMELSRERLLTQMHGGRLPAEQPLDACGGKPVDKSFYQERPEL